MTGGVSLFIEPVHPRLGNDALFEVANNRFAGADILAPYAHLRDWMGGRGVAVHTADWLMGGQGLSELNLYVSMGNLDNYARLRNRDDVVLSAFFALECPIVEPSLYRALGAVEKHFKRVYSFSDSDSLRIFTGTRIDCKAFAIPQSFRAVNAHLWGQEERHFLTMINANKLPRLNHQELYTERLRAVEYFSRTGDIDLYGIGWDRAPNRVGKTWIPHTLRRWQRELLTRWHKVRPDPLLAAARRVYRGPTDSKLETLSQYTFALCFENSILKGWITEKIFDCLFVGTIPIYWGAPDIEAYVPPDCFIDMRHFGNYAALRSFLKSLSPDDIRHYKVRAREYLASPRFEPFTKEAFVRMFGCIVEEDSGVVL